MAVVAHKIQQASGKLQKWDQMATKISELTEQRKQEAREKELKIQQKLEQKQKNKEDHASFQKSQTMERLKKWQNRRENLTLTTMVSEKKRLALSNKLTKAQSDEIARQRALQQED